MGDRASCSRLRKHRRLRGRGFGTSRRLMHSIQGRLRTIARFRCGYKQRLGGPTPRLGKSSKRSRFGDGPASFPQFQPTQLLSIAFSKSERRRDEKMHGQGAARARANLCPLRNVRTRRSMSLSGCTR